jgi:hypothetical protein
MNRKVPLAVPFPIDRLHSFADVLLAYLTTPSIQFEKGGNAARSEPLLFETAKTFIDASGLSLEGVVTAGLRSSPLLNGTRSCSVLLSWTYLRSVRAYTGSPMAAVHVSSVLHDAFTGIYHESGPVITALEAPRTWALERKHPTINELGRTSEKVYLSMFQSVWCLTCTGEDVQLSAVKIDWDSHFEVETTGSSLALRPGNAVTVGVARGVGGPNSWFCNDKIGIHCDDETLEVTVYSLGGKKLSRIDMSRWVVEPSRTLDLHPYARSFCYDGEVWFVVLHDFEGTRKVFVAPFTYQDPSSIALVPVAKSEEPVIGWASVCGYKGAFYPRKVLSQEASFYIVNSSGRTSTQTIDGSKASITTSTGFSCAASEYSIFVSDHERIIYEFDRQLKMTSRVDLGTEALVTRCGQRVLAITNEMIYECSPRSVRPLKRVDFASSAVGCVE